MNSALVIGGTGCLGSALVNNLIDKGWQVSTAGRNSGNPEVFEHFYLDLNSPLPLPEDKKYDFVYYLAQDMNFRNYPDSITSTFRINSFSAFSICKWAKNNSGKFIYASTGSVYAKKNSPLFEHDDYEISNQLSPYVLSKILAERLISEFDENCLILRPFFIYGPNADRRMLIPSLIDSLKTRKNIQIDQFGGITINPVYSLDAAEAIFLIGEKLSGFVNIAGAENISIQGLSQSIAGVVGLEPIFTQILSENKRTLLGDIDKIESLGWKQINSFEINIRHLIATS